MSDRCNSCGALTGHAHARTCARERCEHGTFYTEYCPVPECEWALRVEPAPDKPAPAPFGDEQAAMQLLGMKAMGFNQPPQEPAPAPCDRCQICGLKFSHMSWCEHYDKPAAAAKGSAEWERENKAWREMFERTPDKLADAPCDRCEGTMADHTFSCIKHPRHAKEPEQIMIHDGPGGGIFIDKPAAAEVPREWTLYVNYENGLSRSNFFNETHGLKDAIVHVIEKRHYDAIVNEGQWLAKEWEKLKAERDELLNALKTKVPDLPREPFVSLEDYEQLQRELAEAKESWETYRKAAEHFENATKEARAEVERLEAERDELSRQLYDERMDNVSSKIERAREALEGEKK